MWRDPLDELIEDLERVAPAPRPATEDMFTLLQRLTDAIPYRPSELERRTVDPVHQELLRELNERLRR